MESAKKSNVREALDIVCEEVERESNRVFKVGGEALMAGHLEPAEQAIAYAKKLKVFVEKVKGLTAEWCQLGAEIERATPEVQDIVRMPEPLKPAETGIDNEEISHRTNFRVILPDGNVIEDKFAKDVFAKTLNFLGPEKVASLNLFLGEEPLVSNNKAVYIKNPTQVSALNGGWYTKTHSGTREKIKLVEKIAKALEVDLRVTLIQ